MGDSDVVFEDEWEEVQAGAAATGADTGDITITLGDASELDKASKQRKPVAGRAYTKQEREDALQVHRVHALCLLAHALLHDQAAADTELQSLMISLLPEKLLDAAAAAATSEDPSAADWLPDLMRWFHRSFTITNKPYFTSTTQQQQQQQQQPGSKSGADGSSAGAAAWHDELLVDLGLQGSCSVSVRDQLLCCAGVRRGSAIQLVALLVATLRGIGFLTRSVWSLDPLPFKPAAVEALARGSSLRPKLPAAAAANGVKPGRTGNSNSGGLRGRKRSRAAAAATAEGTVAGGAAAAGGSGGRGRKRAKSAAHRHNNNNMSAAAAAAAEDEDEEAEQEEDGDTRQLQDEQQRKETEQQQQQLRKRRGDEEFELQLAMAVASTAAAAESRAAAAAAGGSSSTGRPPGSNLPAYHNRNQVNSPSKTPPSSLLAAPAAAAATGKPSFTTLIHKGASPAALKAAAAAAAKTPQGFLWQPNPSFVPKMWCEVYVGSSSAGRWCHVDGLLGCYDQPGVVEAATARALPLSYVVACQAGAPKDVTRRYAANFTVNLRWRDESWWSSTVNALRSTAAHIPKHLAQQMAQQKPQQQHTRTAAAAANQAQQQQQQKQQQQQVQPAHCSTQIPNVPTSHDQSLLQIQLTAGSSKATPTAAAAAGSSDAVLRGAREDAELSCRADRQAAAPPTTIDGFKTHPLYVLQRHITKYQALAPDAAKLGTHRGESFYSRHDLHDLHTRERWRREGRDVKPSELDKPAKVIKKRAVPTAATASAAGGGGGFGRSSSNKYASGWGAWQRSVSSSRTGSGSLQQPAQQQQQQQQPEAPPLASAADRTQSAPAPAAAADTSEDGSAAGSDNVLLYGYWQTDDWFPPAAVGGKVPKNERGNVEVPPFAKALPAGTKHISLPGLAPLCRQLGIDFAPALVGFDVLGGRMVPRVEGVVVCQEFEQDLVELYLQREQEKAAAELQRLQQEAAAAWKQLINSMRTRLQLQKKYGAAAAAARGGSECVLLDGAQSLLQQERSAAAGTAKQIVQGLHAAQQQLGDAVARAVDNTAATNGRSRRSKSLPGSICGSVLTPVNGSAAQPGLGVLAAAEVQQQQEPAIERQAPRALQGVEVEEF